MNGYLSLSFARLGFLLLLPFAAVGQTLSEQEILLLGLQHPNFDQLLKSRRDEADAELILERTWSNPEFSISHQEIDGETEVDIWLKQTFDFSGRRQYAIAVAQTHLSVIDLENKALQIERLAQVRGLFYQLLYLQRKSELFSQWVNKFTDVEATMAVREAAGDVSGYDRMRMSRERVELDIQREQYQLELETIREKLHGFIATDRSLDFNSVTGTLLPSAQPALEKVLSAHNQHPILLSLQKTNEAKTARIRATARGHIPLITFAVGQKVIERSGQRDAELMLSASVPLPLFDRKQGEHRRALAEANRAASQYQLLLQRNVADIRALWIKAKRLTERARSYREHNVVDAEQLVDIVQAAYQSGEKSVVELVDGYRMSLAAEQKALELAYEARQVRLDLDLLSGMLRLQGERS